MHDPLLKPLLKRMLLALLLLLLLLLRCDVLFVHFVPESRCVSWLEQRGSRRHLHRLRLPGRILHLVNTDFVTEEVNT